MPPEGPPEGARGRPKPPGPPETRRGARKPEGRPIKLSTEQMKNNFQMESCLEYFESPQIAELVSSRLGGGLDLRLFQTFLRDPRGSLDPPPDPFETLIREEDPPSAAREGHSGVVKWLWSCMRGAPADGDGKVFAMLCASAASGGRLEIRREQQGHALPPQGLPESRTGHALPPQRRPERRRGAPSAAEATPRAAEATPSAAEATPCRRRGHALPPQGSPESRRAKLAAEGHKLSEGRAELPPKGPHSRALVFENAPERAREPPRTAMMGTPKIVF